MAASILGRYSIPAKAFLEQSEVNGAGDMTEFRNTLDRNIPFYEIPSEPPRMNRNTKIPPPRRLLLSSATIVVVPRNLLHQWLSEIQKHVIQGGLKILVLDTIPKRGSKVKSASYDGESIQFQSKLLAPTELLNFDLVLFTRNRFEQEFHDDQTHPTINQKIHECNGLFIGGTWVSECNCAGGSERYVSPLKKIHWLRIIIDEGHSFSSSMSNAVLFAKQIEAERRWVVSGSK